MYLHALATAVPPTTFTQPECWAIVEKSGIRSRLHAALDADPAQHPAGRPRDRTQALRAAGDRPGLRPHGGRAERRLPRGGAEARRNGACRPPWRRRASPPGELDALLICTCTGYLCPGLTSYVAEQLGLRPNAVLHDLVGLGCGAAIPTLRAASHLLAAQPEAVVACVAVEMCSAAFYLDDDPGVIISACLFSDGAAATVWRSDARASSGLRAFDFESLHLPAERDKLRFEQRGGKLRNLLDRTVPELAAGAVGRLWADRGAAARRARRRPSRGPGCPRGPGPGRRAPLARARARGSCATAAT